MPILFVPNDPLAVAVVPPREQPPRADRDEPQLGFVYAAATPQGVYPVDSAEFRFWQCREAALATLEAWSAIAPLPRTWQTGARLLPLVDDAGPGLNAFYDRTAVKFFGWRTDTRQTYPAASTDAVAHEVGHALLDALRPELWDSAYTETAAFHEAFADCMALLVGLFDAPTRDALLHGAADLHAANFLEALSEDVAEGVRVERGVTDPHSMPRRALNALRWEIPVNLPPVGPPAALSAEAHSFSRVFTGCFYDALCNIFASQPTQDDDGLLTAARTAGALLVAGAQAAPEVARFFQAVGRAMILADEGVSGGAHHLAIRNAFAGHNIAIGSTVMLAPTSALAGSAPSVDTATGAVLLPADAHRDLRRRLGARGGRLSVRTHGLPGRVVANVVHHRGVALGTLHRRLKGVVVPAAESVLVGASATRAAILGQLPDAAATIDEVHHFVGTLVEHAAVAFAPKKRTRRKPAAPEPSSVATHAIEARGGKKVLRRIGFACGPRWSPGCSSVSLSPVGAT